MNLPEPLFGDVPVVCPVNQVESVCVRHYPASATRPHIWGRREPWGLGTEKRTLAVRVSPESLWRGLAYPRSTSRAKGSFHSIIV